MEILDCYSRSPDPVGKGLSNLIVRHFVFDDIACVSMEGWLQSLKFEDPEFQREVAQLSGYLAFKTGQTGNAWKLRQTLFWKGVEYPRASLDYQELLTRAYDAQYDQSPDLKDCLWLSIGQALRHTMGKHDTRDTVLTESEYIRQLDRLRWRRYHNE